MAIHVGRCTTEKVFAYNVIVGAMPQGHAFDDRL